MRKTAKIITSRLQVVPFSERHLTKRYISWLNDQELMRFSEQRHRNHNIETCREYWRSFEGSPNFFWAVEELFHGRRHIGNINAYVDSVNKVVDVGILIGESDAQNKGYATEALQAVIEYLLIEIGYRKITMGAIAPNTGMLTVMKRLGMVADGVRFKHYIFEGEAVNVIHMAVFKKDTG